MMSTPFQSHPEAAPAEVMPGPVDPRAEARTRRRISLVSAAIGSLCSAMLLCGWGIRIGVDEAQGAREGRVIHEPFMFAVAPRLDRLNAADAMLGSDSDWRTLRDQYDRLVRDRSDLVTDADRATREIDLTYAAQIDLLRRMAEGRHAAANGENALALVEFADQQEALKSILERSQRMMDEVASRAADPQSASVQRQRWYIQSRFGEQVAELRARMESIFQDAEADIAQNRLHAAELVESCARLEEERREVVARTRETTQSELAAMDEELKRLRSAIELAYRADAASLYARERQADGMDTSSLAVINRQAARHVTEILARVGADRRVDRVDALADASISQ